MRQRQIVLDTNVVVSALRSTEGAAYRLLLAIDTGLVTINMSLPLSLEYEDVCMRPEHCRSLAKEDINDLLDRLFSIARWTHVDFKWPIFTDRSDEKLLELAVAAGSDCIVTFNKRHFAGSEKLGIEVLTPSEFLHSITGRP